MHVFSINYNVKLSSHFYLIDSVQLILNNMELIYQIYTDNSALILSINWAILYIINVLENALLIAMKPGNRFMQVL